MKQYSVKVTKTIKADRECSNCAHKWVVSEETTSSAESYFSAESAAQNARETLQKNEPAEVKSLNSSDKNILCPVCNHFAKSAMKEYFSRGFADWLIKAYSKSLLRNAIAVIVLIPITLLLMRAGTMVSTIAAFIPAFFSIWCLINFVRCRMNFSKTKKTVKSFSDEEIRAVTVKTYKENKGLVWKKIIEILFGKKSRTIPWLKFKFSGLIIMIITIIGLGIYYTRYDLGIVSALKLRSDYTTLSKEDVGSMLKDRDFFAKEVISKEEIINKELSNPNGGFRNYYHFRNHNGDKVVIDKATGLMWHCLGSAENFNRNSYRGGSYPGKMSFENSQQWIKELNLRNYAGYSDWRLPTLEEAVSLLESSKSTGRDSGELYIDSILSRHKNKYTRGKTIAIWSGDRHGSDSAWIVNFRLGRVESFNLNHTCQIRPVRVIK